MIVTLHPEREQIALYETEGSDPVVISYAALNAMLRPQGLCYYRFKRSRRLGASGDAISCQVFISKRAFKRLHKEQEIA